MNKKCLYCKKNFFSRREVAKFCCRQCSDKGRVPKLDVKCLVCKKLFKEIPYRVEKRGRKFCSSMCFQRHEVGRNNPAWKGGKIIGFHGYIFTYIGNGKYTSEHRLVMEKYLGRNLTPVEVIHHVNGNKKDNRIENLVIITRSKHNKIHIQERKKKFGGTGMPSRWGKNK